ncbi:recombination regulator RecX [Streptomyces sp. NPDC088794]|uniref:recombination regulator RecX n=1 Tax=Streptomyces sp. NPDC088794 TaxID=3365902 RepID=UPI0037F25DED
MADLAERANPGAPRERGREGDGDGGSAEPDGDAYGNGSGQGADGRHGRAAKDGNGRSDGTSRSDGEGKASGAGRWSYGSGGSDADEPGHGADEGFGRAVGHGSEASRGTGVSYGSDGPYEGGGSFGEGGGASGRGAWASRGGSRGGGTRGRQRRRRGESAGEDGGSPSSSRAEQEGPSGDPVERARAICLRLLTGTPRTRKQLADALRKREIPDEAAEEVLSRFEEVGLINDGAFAEAWVESRHHGRGLARRALARELRTKGVDSTLIDEAVGQLDSEQEEETARELVARKLRATRGLDRDKRLRRLAGMLARKGYPEGMALRVVRQALEEEGEDTESLGDEGF